MAAITMLALLLAAPDGQARDPSVAALQVALRSKGVYQGPVDGVRGKATTRAVMELQRRQGLVVDGVVGPATRKALGHLGRHRVGTRPLEKGDKGFDVAALQFQLAWHGFPSGEFDGVLGKRSRKAVKRFQRWAGLPADGIAGGATFAALRSPPPLAPVPLHWPLPPDLTDYFGPRDGSFHAGIDIAAWQGTPVASSKKGRVAFAGWYGAFGNLVIVQHRKGVRTLYGHLSEIHVQPGQNVSRGETIGMVGSTGRSTGPHLHFEVRVRGAAVDPLSGLS